LLRVVAQASAVPNFMDISLTKVRWDAAHREKAVKPSLSKVITLSRNPKECDMYIYMYAVPLSSTSFLGTSGTTFKFSGVSRPGWLVVPHY
jgi:hypothetical protein